MPRQSLPSIPQVPKGLPPEQTRFLQALADACRIRFGQTKNEVDRSVTVGELEGTGIIVRNGSNVAAGVVTGDGSVVTTGGNSAAFTDQTTPSAPTGLTVGTPDSTTVLLNWDPPTDTQDYIAYAEVFRSINDDFDVYETNEDTGSTTANDVVFVGTGAYGFADHFEQGSAPVGGYYYFVRWRTYADNAGSAAESGAVTPALDPANLLAALSEADADDALVFDEISEFIVKADTFKIRSPDVGGNAIGDLIFAVDTQNNQVVMDGAYIKALTVTNAQIANTTIGTAQIDTIAGNKITVGTLEADRIVLDGAVLGTYDNNGTIELTVNGIRLNTTNAAGDNVLQDESGNALSDTTVLNTNTTWAQVLNNGGNNLPTENLVGQGATNPTASSYSQGDFWYNTTDNAFYVLLLIGDPAVETWVKWGDVTADNIPQAVQDGADAGTGLVEGTVSINDGSVPFSSVSQFGGVYWGATAPADPTTQTVDEYAATIWIDTSTTPYTSKYWNGTAWVIASTVGAQTGASGNLIDENGVPIVDASATNRQQQALGVLGQRIAFETGSLSYVAHEDGTDLYINQAKSLSQADSADTGTISVTAGDIITSNRPVSLHNESGYPIPSIAHTGYKFITHTNRGTTQRFKIYAPFAAGIIKYAQEAAPGGQSIGSHVDWPGNNGTVTWSSTGVPLKTVTTIDISTTDNTAIYHIFYSDTPIVMVKWNTDNEDFAWVPRTENEVVGARTAAFASFTADPVSSITGATEGAKYYYALSPIGAISNADGSGGDADHYVPINALGDTYYIHHAIDGFQIVALEATTIKAEYWSGTAWTSYATYDLEDATRADIGETFVGSLSGGTATALQSGAAPWRFIGSGRFYLRTNDPDGDEYPVIGYWSELRTWDVNPQAGDIDFADLGGVKPPADATRNIEVDYTFATDSDRTNQSTTNFSGGEIALVTETGALWLWDGAGWIELSTIGAQVGINVYTDGGVQLTNDQLLNSSVDLGIAGSVVSLSNAGSTTITLDAATNIDNALAYTGGGTFSGDLAATNNLMGSGTAFPTNPAPTAGDLFYRTDEKKLYEYTGSAWENWATLNTGELADKDSVDYTTGEVTNTPTSLTDINVGEYSSLQSITSIPLVIPGGNSQTVTQVGLDIQSSGNQSTGTWSTQFYSKDASVGGCAVTFTVGSTNSRYMIGLNSNPTSNASYTSIDYAWFVRGSSGDYRIYENGNNIQTVSTTPTAGDILVIGYDGTTIRYMLNGVVQRSVVPATQPSSLALDSSIDGIGSQHTTTIKNINFINIGATLPTLGTNVLAEDGSTLLADEDLRNSALDVSTSGATLSVTYGANTSTGVTLDASSNIDNALYYTAGATEFTGEIDATHNSILAAAASDPTGQAGEFYYNTTDKEWKYYDGSAWVAVSTFNTGALADKDAVDLGTSEVTGTLGTGNADAGLINTNVQLTNSGSTLSLTGGNAATVTLDASIVDNALAFTGGGTYTGDLAATAGATWGTDVGSIPANLSSLTGTEGIENSAVNLSVSGTTFGLSGAGATTYTLDQSNVGLTGVQDYATISTASNAINADPFFTNRAKWVFGDANQFSYTTTTTSPAAGDTILQGTSSSGSSGNNEFFSEVMPLDPSKPYKITVWARQTAGNRLNYLTVRFLDVNGTDITTSGNSTGWPSSGTYWYWGVTNAVFPSAWTRYEIHFGGSHGPIIPTSARSIRIGALCLRSIDVTSPTTSTIEFAQYTIEEAQTDITVIPNALQRTGGGNYTGDLAATAGATWGTDVGSIPSNLSGLAGTEEIQNANIDYANDGSGTLPAAQGGTGITDFSTGAYANANIDYSSDGSGTLPAAQGGTGLTSTSTLLNANVNLSISGQTFGLSGAGATTYTVNQGNVGLSGVTNNADQTSANTAAAIAGQAASATTDTTNAANISTGSLPNGRYSASGIAQYTQLAGALNKNPYFAYSNIEWPDAGQPGNGVDISYITESSSPSGGPSVFYYQDNSAGDNSFFTDRIPIDPEQVYTITVWARQLAGNKKNYISCWFENSSGTLLDGSSNPAGWPAAGTYHYWGVANDVFPSAWTKYEISIGGTNRPQIPATATTVRIGMLALRSTGVASPTASSLQLAEYSIREGNPQATAESYTVGGVTTITSPKDGTYSNNTNVTGAVVISLPHAGSTMIRFEVDIYNYVTNESITYRIGGHTAGTPGKWYNVSASNPYGNLYHKVRFGRNAANTGYAVQIGETNTSWAYPQVRVRNVTVGYANYDAKYWSENWSVTLETNNILDGNGTSTDVQEIADTRGNANWQWVGGVGVPADNADVTSANTAAGISGQGTLATANTVNLATTAAGGVSGELPTANANVDLRNNTSSGGVTSILAPGGGRYRDSGSATGNIRIYLPSTASTMLNFQVDIYNYVAGTSHTYLISGHTSGQQWYQVSATTPFGSLPRTVRFGYESNKYVISIGETNSTWSYPNILIRNLTVGYANETISNWNDGWTVDISTSSIGSVTQTVSDTRGNASWPLVGGTGVPTDNADVTSANTAAAISGQGALATQSSVTSTQMPLSARGNLIDLTNWLDKAAGDNTPSSWGLNGTQAMNKMAVDTGPGAFGGNQLLWHCIGDNTGNNQGGWGGSPDFTPDANKAYRIITPVFVYTTDGSAANGNFYLGPEGNSVTSLNSTTTLGNPYWVIGDRSDVQRNRWYLMVGYVYPYNTTGWTQDGSGLWDMVTGKKVGNGTSFNWVQNPGGVSTRSYMYYTTNDKQRQYMAPPIIQVADGSEPPLSHFFSAGAIENSSTTTFETDKSPSATWSALVSSAQVTGPVAPYDVTITWRDGLSTSLGTTVIRMSYTGSGTSFTSVDHSTQSNSAGATVSLNSTNTATRNVSSVTLNGKTVVLDSNVVNGISWSFSK